MNGMSSADLIATENMRRSHQVIDAGSRLTHLTSSSAQGVVLKHPMEAAR